MLYKDFCRAPPLQPAVSHPTTRIRLQGTLEDKKAQGRADPDAADRGRVDRRMVASRMVASWRRTTAGPEAKVKTGAHVRPPAFGLLVSGKVFTCPPTIKLYH